MINRAPGLKIVLNALFAAIPDVLNVAAVCFMFFIIFAILGVNYFKGILKSCQGEGFDTLPRDVSLFIEKPVSWDSATLDQRSWFGPLSNISTVFSVDEDTGNYTNDYDCKGINSAWPDSACCSSWPESSKLAPTSHEVK